MAPGWPGGVDARSAWCGHCARIRSPCQVCPVDRVEAGPRLPAARKKAPARCRLLRPPNPMIMLRSVFTHLEGKEETAQVSRAASEHLSSEGKTALGWELQYVAETIDNKDGDGDGLDNAKTAKDSIEKMLGRKLPQKIKDLLEVLNEILKIATGRGDQAN